MSDFNDFLVQLELHEASVERKNTSPRAPEEVLLNLRDRFCDEVGREEYEKMREAKKQKLMERLQDVLDKFMSSGFHWDIEGKRERIYPLLETENRFRFLMLQENLEAVRTLGCGVIDRVLPTTVV